jgi:hypothetical protein
MAHISTIYRSKFEILSCSRKDVEAIKLSGYIILNSYGINMNKK